MNIKVYKYGLLPPIENAKIVRDAFYLGNKYRNALVENEITRRKEYRQARAQHVPGVAAAELAVKAAEAAVELEWSVVQAARVQARKKTPVHPEYKTAKLALKDARAQLRLERTNAKESELLKEAAKQINEKGYAETKRLRSECGVYWGTYLLVEEAFERSVKDCTREGRDPGFSRYSGEGRIGVQLQNGLTVENAFKEHSQLRVVPVTEEAWTGPRGAQKRASRTVLSIRVGSEASRKPIFAKFPMTMFRRPLPDGGVITGVTVQMYRIGTTEKWEACFTVRMPETQQTTRDGVLALDLGWRLKDRGVRVGYYTTDDDVENEIKTPDGFELRLDFSATLRGIQDTQFNAHRDQLQSWLRTNKAILPEWLIERTEYLPAWKGSGQRRLTLLCFHWAENRFAGDEAAFADLDAWRKQARHLYQWESHQRERTLGYRKETYRTLAAQLAEKYGTLILEKFDLREFAAEPAREDTAFDVKQPRAQRVQTAPAEFRLLLIQAFKSRAGLVIELNPAHTTQCCHACGHTEEFNAAASIEHTCVNCGRIWDQDVNAARNLLAMYKQTLGQPLAAE